MSVLNFGRGEKKQVKEFLESFEEIKTKTPFEEYRCKILNSTVTLYNSGKVTIQGRDDEEVKDSILKELKLSDSLLLGIDETGRGEKTGPMVIASVLGKTNSLRELRDSKKIKDIKSKHGLVTKKSLANASISFNAEYLDILRKKGFNLNEIEAETINALHSLFHKFEKKLNTVVDGHSIKGINRKVTFLAKGDDLEPVIGAASVIAKHARNESKNKETRKTWKSKDKNE